MIRVLHVLGKLNRGGTETMLINLFRNIDRSKVVFDFVVHTNDICDYDDEVEALGGKIYRIPRYVIVNSAQYIKEWNNFFRKHKEYKIIHGHMGSTASIYLKIARKYNLYTIVHSHNNNPANYTLKDVLYKILSFPTRYIADYFFACSLQAGIDRFGKKVVKSSGRFEVFPNAIETKKFIYNVEIREKIRKHFAIEDNFVIGTVGRMVSQKNPFFIIDILEEIVKKRDDVKLLWVGDGELRNEIEQAIVDKGLKEKVILAGSRNDVFELYQGMDVFFFPSKYEGLGIVAIEAQASGLPCIVSDSLPVETNITSFIEYISLKESKEVWSNKLLTADLSKRENMYDAILAAGFDVNMTGKNLMEFYKAIGKKIKNDGKRIVNYV